MHTARATQHVQEHVSPWRISCSAWHTATGMPRLFCIGSVCVLLSTILLLPRPIDLVHAGEMAAQLAKHPYAEMCEEYQV